MERIYESSNFYICKNRTNFINNNYSVICGEHEENNLTGSNVHSSKQTSFVVAMGEYLERRCLFKENKFLCDKNIEAYSLYSKRYVTISRECVKQRYLFIDSCGMATHKTSYECINNALYEFIERQSFIYNYLSKSQGKIIDNKDIKLDTNLKNIKFYNISLIEGFYVVIGKGLNKGKFHCGLGSSPILNDAIEKCIKELRQSVIFLKNFTHIENKTIDYGDIYGQLDPKVLDKAYMYLDNSKKICKEKLINNIIDLDTICKKLWLKCKIEPMITVYNTRSNGINFKAVQIFDLNWFPSLNPSTYREENYQYVEKIMNKKLDRNCNFIPFP